jgi:hypothetical protein
MANPLSNLASLQNMVPADALKKQLSQIPAYRSNRERAAVVLGQGLDAYEAYTRLRPWVFGASVAGAITCAYMLWWRRRHGVEAKVLYGGGFAVCAVAAWLTRPPAAAPAAAAASTPEDRAGAGVVAAIDARRAENAKKDPQWADKVMARVAALPGVREEVAAAPVLRAVLG